MSRSSSLYRRHRFPGEIINYCVWLYYRFSLSYRDIEELMAQRGVRVSYETIRQWCLKFGQTIADELRRRRPQPGDKWHLDEVYLKINGRTYYLWRTVDQEGVVLDILVQSRRNKQAAIRFLGRLLARMQYVPGVIITDKLKSYGGAIKELSSWRSITANIRASTTGQRTPTSRLASGNEECGASSRRSKLNGSWHHLV